MTPADIILLCTIFGIPAAIISYAIAAFILRRPHDLPDDLSDSYPGSLIGTPLSTHHTKGS